jgi:ferredoxin, 2Fe-2S
MPTLNFLCADGTTHQVEAASGLSVMEVAINNGVTGITAECGGACACATCHIYVEAGANLPEADGMESDMLEFAWEPKDTSRLSCQIKVTDDIDGMTFNIPAEQA